MIASPVMLLSIFGTGLVLMSIASLAIMRLQARQERLYTRIARTTAPFQRRGSSVAALLSSGVGLAAAAEGIRPVLMKLFGFDPKLQDHYKLPWWMALVLTLATSIAIVRLASEVAGHLAWLTTPFIWCLLSRGFFNWCERGRRDKLFTQFPDALAMIVRAVRVGIPVTESISAVAREIEAPTGPEFRRLGDELAIGVLLADALVSMAERNGLQEYRFFATALALQSQTGGGLSETLENLADVIRKRVAVRQKGAALSAEAKMSALVLAALPPLAAIGLWFMNSSYITLLLFDPRGRKILGAAVLALFLGIMTMRTMIRKSLT